MSGGQGAAVTLDDLATRAGRRAFAITRDGVWVEIEVAPADAPTVPMWGPATEEDLEESYAMYPDPEMPL